MTNFRQWKKYCLCCSFSWLEPPLLFWSQPSPVQNSWKGDQRVSPALGVCRKLVCTCTCTFSHSWNKRRYLAKAQCKLRAILTLSCYWLCNALGLHGKAGWKGT